MGATLRRVVGTGGSVFQRELSLFLLLASLALVGESTPLGGACRFGCFSDFDRSHDRREEFEQLCFGGPAIAGLRALSMSYDRQTTVGGQSRPKSLSNASLVQARKLSARLEVQEKGHAGVEFVDVLPTRPR